METVKIVDTLLGGILGPPGGGGDGPDDKK
jgi:hypothetical protein